MGMCALGTALLLRFAIIAIGAGYVASPVAATRGFELPFPESSAFGMRGLTAMLMVLAATPLMIGET
jgi:hypothetical protein